MYKERNLGFLGFPNYVISENGDLFSLKYRKKNMRRKLRKKFAKNNKYVRYSLGKSKTMLAHRLVALAFIENPNDEREVNHKDGNPRNNKVSNLEWCSRSYNGLHSYRVNKRKPPKRLVQPVMQIDKTTKKVISVFNSIKAAAIATGVDSSCIAKVCLKRPKYKTAGGFIWKAKGSKRYMTDSRATVKYRERLYNLSSL